MQEVTLQDGTTFHLREVKELAPVYESDEPKKRSALLGGVIHFRTDRDAIVLQRDEFVAFIKQWKATR